MFSLGCCGTVVAWILVNIRLAESCVLSPFKCPGATLLASAQSKRWNILP